MKRGGNFPTLIDVLDIGVLISVWDKPRGVLELTNLFKVEHKTIKSHLGRLLLLDLITIKEEGGNRKRINITPFGNSFLEGVRKYMKISKSSDKEQSKEVTRITKLLKSSN